ncbi:MAG: ppdk2 [Clostridia bacterium]|nr:ppdk2 [Clostridia bacterium]
MDNQFNSRALEVNLAETRYKTIILPDKHSWFLELSKSYWGIHKRTEEFIMEYNHPYVNYDYVIENLHNICLADLWLYNSNEKSEEALMVLVEMFQNMMSKDLKEKLREQLITTMMKFIDRLAKLGNYPSVIIHRCLFIIKEDMKQYEILYIRNSGYFKTYLNKIAEEEEYRAEIFDLTKDLLSKCIIYWEKSSMVEAWFEDKKHLFKERSREKLKLLGKPFFDELHLQLQEASNWHELTEIMFFNDIANYFRRYIEQLDSSLEKIYFLFYLLHSPAMSQLTNHLLYDLNRILRDVFKELDESEVNSFLENIIDLFEELKPQHITTVLDCISTLGKGVIDTKDQKIISFFINKLIHFGFVHPGEISISSDWQIRVNTNHIKNIRIWLELIGYSPGTLKELLSALIVNLKLGGIFISDTDLFQRDVTKLLNSNIAAVYKQIKQLARNFPVYFKEIGAEGKLREVTTVIDELSYRKDRLIHFLRKQVHTESNNTHVELTKKILQFWYDGKLEQLKQAIPLDVYESIQLEGEWFVDVHKITKELCAMKQANPEKLLELEEKEIEAALAKIEIENERDKKRVSLIFQLYNLLLEKYSLESGNIISILKGYRFFNNNEILKLSQLLENSDGKAALHEVFRLMHHLKQVILDTESSEALENIYYKRHVAVGIPSMYGQYLEPKFEALGLMFRLEKVASNLMEKLVGDINPDYLTAKTLQDIYDIFALFQEGLELDGIENQGFNSNFQMLKYSLTSPSFSLDQYINIFQFMAQNVKEIINEYFLRVYDHSLKVVIHQLKGEGLGEEEAKEVYLKTSENFYREVLSSAFLIQQLDNYISNIVNSLRNLVDNHSSEFIKNMLTYNPDLMISPLYKPTVDIDSQVFVGAKAYYLKKLHSYGFPIPTGFVLTTELFRHKNTILNHSYMNQELDNLIKEQIEEIEKITGLEFGNPSNPLMLSVRSGTAISMPGAMSTFLNVGLNDEIVEALSQKPNFSWTSWDCYRRFIQSWGMSCGIKRDVFDSIIINYKKKYKVEQKVQFTPEQMKNIAVSYKQVLKDHDIHIEKEPYKQLKQAIISVIESWGSHRAKSYREHLQIADEWGTAVIVQKMVLGNIALNSGTGVVFTHDPNQNKPGLNLYGDFTLCSQGEDIVAGLVHTLPVTEIQRNTSYTDSPLSLQSSHPEIYARLIELSNQLIDTYGFNHQEIEFTFESEKPEDLYILQTRDQNINKQDIKAVFDSPVDGMRLAGRGIGIGGGAMSGMIVFDQKDIQTLKKANPEAKFILVRPDTVPDDIPMIFKCDGLVTGKGGATSHAAVTASKLGKVCIVNCKALRVNEQKKECEINGVVLRPGEVISIDGNLGNIYLGEYPISFV